MAIHTTDAIVLRQYPFRETSLLVTCLTSGVGKLRGIIKGIRGERTRYRSAMEALTVNRIVYYDSRTSPLHLISQCELTEPFGGLTQDLHSMRLAAACGELIDILLEDGEHHPGVFELLRATLSRLATGGGEPLVVHSHFVLRLLRLVGFHPQLDQCAGCNRRDFADGGYWSVPQGGLLCERCLHQDPRAESIPQQMVALLSAFSESDAPVSLDPMASSAIHRRLDEFLRWRVDRPLRTLSGVPVT